MGFGQKLIVFDGNRLETARPDSNVNPFCALCEKTDNYVSLMLCPKWHLETSSRRFWMQVYQMQFIPTWEADGIICGIGNIRIARQYISIRNIGNNNELYKRALWVYSNKTVPTRLAYHMLV